MDTPTHTAHSLRALHAILTRFKGYLESGRNFNGHRKGVGHVFAVYESQGEVVRMEGSRRRRRRDTADQATDPNGCGLPKVGQHVQKGPTQLGENDPGRPLRGMRRLQAKKERIVATDPLHTRIRHAVHALRTLSAKDRRKLVEAPFPTFHVSSPHAHGGTWFRQTELPTNGRRHYIAHWEDEETLWRRYIKE